MNNINNIPGTRTAFLLFFIVSSACLGIGQTKNSKDVAPAAPTQIVDARQSGEWNVGIDPVKNVVRLQNSAADPLPITIANTTGRQEFQVRAGISVFAGGPSSHTETYINIPDGRRFVIENITAYAEIPNGESISLSFLSRLDTTPSGNAMYQYIDVHSQGVFADKTVFTANHKTLAYAVYRLAVDARPTWLSGTGYATVTFSGYLENLPVQ